MTRASARHLAGDAEGALEDYARAASDGAGPEALLLRGGLLHDLGRRMEAEEVLRRARAAAPENAAIAFRLARVLADGGAVAEARLLAEEAVARSPSLEEARAFLASLGEGQ